VVNARHKILADLRPLWRKVGAQVAAVGRDSRDLLQRAHRIDTHIAAFRELCANRADVRVDSFIARWVVAAVLTGSAVVLAVLNAELLALPLAALLSPMDGAVVGLTAAAYTAAIVATALLLSESSRVTRLLPLIGNLPRHSRILLTLLAGSLLTALVAGEALLMTAVNTVASTSLSQPLPTWGIVAVAVSVPLLLALLTPAIESLLATTRPVLVSLLIGALSLAGLLLRLAGRLWMELGQLCHHLYDIIIFLPMALERAWRRHRATAVSTPPQTPSVERPVVRALDFDRGAGGKR
ncbi:MAG: hypothetical protein RBS88_13265, partial [Spongiibacteraceae bacterium]|jgi:hypothetical protein|nr:hypothetical protein [Spongiibacteraceae bacterium]